MSWFIEAIITGVSAFGATNIDDIVILTVLFSQANTSLQVQHIIIGQYLGFIALVMVSLVGFLGGLIIPKTWIGLLGFVPIFIGISQLIKTDEDQDMTQFISPAIPQTSPFNIAHFFNPQTYSVAAITFANGGDNIGIYVPLFANSKPTELLVILSVFMLMIALWCGLAYWLSSHPLMTRFISRFGHRIVPFVLIGLGLFILIDSHSYQLLPFW